LERRRFITAGIALLAQFVAMPRIPLAGGFIERNTNAFDARNPDSVYAALGIEPPQDSQAILIEAPDVAENGAKVPVEVEVRLPGVERLLIIGERNRYPLLADVSFTPTMIPWFEARVRLAETSSIRVIAQAQGQLYTARKPVRVIVGGCPSG
jgi:sulfur-oxidizing protein SoxY